MSAFSHVGRIGPQEIWPGLTGRTVHGDRVTLSLIELEPGIDVPGHAHDNEQVGILLEGSLTFRIGEETRELAPGDTWVIRTDVPHSVTSGPGGAVLVEVFSPPREDWQLRPTDAARPGRWP